MIGAMKQEVEKLKSLINSHQKNQLIDITYWHGKINQHDILLCQSGIGKVNAAVTSSLLIDKYNPDLIINIGSAGGIAKNVQIGDIVMATELNYHDVDVTAFGYQKGQIPDMPEHFKTDKIFVEKIKANNEKNNNKLKLQFGLMLSGDSFINSNDKVQQIKEAFPTALALDMESTVISQVCYKFNKPFVIIRTVSDHADNTSDTDFSTKLIEVSNNLASQLVAIIEKL